jgi:hypothetical protein
VALAAAAAGCGGGGGGTKGLPQGATLAPARAPAFISVRSDFTSSQWKNGLALFRRFPSSGVLLTRLARQTNGVDFDRDVKPALGKEVDVVWLDFAHGGNDVVALTKPPTRKKLDVLLHKLDAADTTQPRTIVRSAGGGWVVLSDTKRTLDRFDALRKHKLADEPRFKDAMSSLDAKAAVRAYVDGHAVQDALDRSLRRSGAAPQLTRDVARLEAVVGSGSAESDGVAIDGGGVLDRKPGAKTYSPTLASELPRGALFYLSFAHLDDPTSLVLRLVGRSKPNFDRQLQSVQGVLNIDLRRDVYPLLRGEGALAVYPQTPYPAVVYLQKVGDETKAQTVLRRISALADLSGSAHSGSTTVDGVGVASISFPQNRVTVYDAVFKGRLLVTNSLNDVRAVVRGGASLADDPVYAAARRRAHVPGDVVAFAYGDLGRALPYGYDLMRRSGSRVSPTARANTKPLESGLLYATKDGNRLRMSGFVTIK